MPGVNRGFSRFPAATVLVAGAALLAAGTQAAFGQSARSDDRAMAVPRLAPPVGGGVALPQPLEAAEAQRVRLAFALQARGRIDDAVRETAQLDMTTLLGAAMVGHLQADRYLGQFTRPHAEELQAWLARYGDLPEAADIHTLLLARLPQGVRPPQRPAVRPLQEAAGRDATNLPPVPEETAPASLSLIRNAALDRDVAEAARQRGGAAVQRILARTPGLSATYASVLAGEAARALFTAGRDEETLAVGGLGARACGHDPQPDCHPAVLSGYMAGLAAWRLGRIELARQMFSRAWRAPLGSSSLRAGAAFWAARTQLVLSDPAAATGWFGRASVEGYTFYGQLARRILGLAATSAPGERDLASHETLGEADIEAVAATTQGLRAFALLQVGQRQRAEAELRLLWPAVRDTPPLARAVMLVAERAGLSEFAAQLADLLQAADGRPREATRFRVPRLRPAGGFRVDQALVYALARTESNFDTTMVSTAGARGILQILPETADFITGPGHGSISRQLHDPAVNLDLGQRYVAYLASHSAVDGDLIRLLVGYNAGPNKLARWAGGIRDLGDPLLFLEAIPADETRAFVPRVLSYTWIFADRLHLPTPSLDVLARGGWPRLEVPEQMAQTIH